MGWGTMGPLALAFGKFTKHICPLCWCLGRGMRWRHGRGHSLLLLGIRRGTAQLQGRGTYGPASTGVGLWQVYQRWAFGKFTKTSSVCLARGRRREGARRLEGLRSSPCQPVCACITSLVKLPKTRLNVLGLPGRGTWSLGPGLGGEVCRGPAS